MVLRGAGPGVTTILLPRPLSQASRGAVTAPVPRWQAMIAFRRSYNDAALADVTAPALRGATTLTVSNGSAFTVRREHGLGIRGYPCMWLL